MFKPFSTLLTIFNIQRLDYYFLRQGRGPRYHILQGYFEVVNIDTHRESINKDLILIKIN